MAELYSIVYMCHIFFIHSSVDGPLSWEVRSLNHWTAREFLGSTNFFIMMPKQLKGKRIVFSGDFPGGPVVKTPYFHCRGHGFHPRSGN